MEVVTVDAYNYIVMVVGKCEKIEWGHLQDAHNTEDIKELYRVKGMPILSKEEDVILSITELVELAQSGKEVEVIIDAQVNEGTIIMVQEVLSYKDKNVGTYREATPVKNEQGEAKYTGIVMGYDESGAVQVYTLMGDVGLPEQWLILEGLELQDTELEEGYDITNQSASKVRLGQAIRFVAKDSDFLSVEDVPYPVEERIIQKIDIINKYI